jgi:pyruvate/2-oxoglutarate dehydrogenase complex dihydrolipoamide acyltransferase (E2) component
MATSAQTLESIIEMLAEKFDFKYEKAIAILAKEELLPKKLMPKQSKEESMFASKKAEELASQHGIHVIKTNGSGKNGKWTLSDVEKALTKPTKTKLLISPNALNFAKEKGISLDGIKGTGKDGRILLKDVQEIIDSDDDDEEEINISPRALQEAHNSNIKDSELVSIHGSGKDGRILLEDIKKYITESEKSDDSGGYTTDGSRIAE